MIGTAGRNSRALDQIHVRAARKLGAATMTAPRAAGILRARIDRARGALPVTNGPRVRSNE